MVSNTIEGTPFRSPYYLRDSCCFRIVQHITTYLDGLERRILNDNFMKICKLQFTSETNDNSNGTRMKTDRCPKIECNSANFNDNLSDTQVVCEISFGKIVHLLKTTIP